MRSVIRARRRSGCDRDFGDHRQRLNRKRAPWVITTVVELSTILWAAPAFMRLSQRSPLLRLQPDFRGGQSTWSRRSRARVI